MGRTGRSRGSLGYALEVMSLKGGQPSPGSVSSTPAHLDASSALVLIYFFSFCSLSSFLDCEQRERWFRDQIFSSVLVGKLVMLVAILTHMKETYKWCQARERKKKKNLVFMLLLPGVGEVKWRRVGQKHVYLNNSCHGFSLPLGHNGTFTHENVSFSPPDSRAGINIYLYVQVTQKALRANFRLS